MGDEGASTAPGASKPTLEIDAVGATRAYKKAVEVYQSGNMKEAVRQFAAVVKVLGPDWKLSVPASAFLAKAQLALKDMRAAAACAVHLIQYPDVSLTRFDGQSSHDLAAEVMGIVEKEAGGNYGTGRALVQRMVENNKTRARADDLRKIGNAAFARKDWAEAIANYSKSAELFDEDATVWSNPSAAHYGAGEFEAAAGAAVMAVQRDIMWNKGYFRLGLALKAAGKLTQALDAMNSAAIFSDGKEKANVDKEIKSIREMLAAAGIPVPDDTSHPPAEEQ